MLIKDLRQFGFSKNMAAIYLSMFDKAETKAGEIIRSTGLHRNIVYTGLQKLEEKKLITKTNKSGVASYKVLNPERLLGELDNKKKLAEQIIEELKSKQPHHTQEIIVHEGVEEIRKNELQLYTRTKKGDVLRYLGISPYWHTVMGTRLRKKAIEIQNKNGFELRALSGFIDDQESNYVAATKNLTTFKIIPDITSREVETIIANDRIIIKTFVEPFSVI
ncbi:MAG: hypothetical protein COU30_00310, partial [Candidatus Magasanikbacteria bacterium CG10_big_fil_rev_8_21_14_0_10_38_6]